MSLCHTNLISRLFSPFYVACCVGPQDDENCQASSFSLTCEPSSYLLLQRAMEVEPGQFCFVVTFPGLSNSHFIHFKIPVILPRAQRKKNQKGLKCAFHETFLPQQTAKGLASGVTQDKKHLQLQWG